MAFSVSYYDLLKKNIRHIYSSLPSNLRFRCDPDPGVTLNTHDGCLQPYKHFPPPVRATERQLHRRLWEYSPEYGTSLPKAPAFRCVSSDEAQIIVDRVSKTQQYRRQQQEDDSVVESCTHLPADSGRRCRSAAEMKALTERITRPTTSFQIRCDLREGQVNIDPVQIVTQRSARRSRD